MRKNSLTALTVLLAFGFVLLVGYTAPGRNIPYTGQPPIQQQAQNYKGNLTGENPPGTTPQNAITIDIQKSDNIRMQLSEMSELSQVGVVVTGNTAIIGYSPSKKAKDVNTTKAMIANRVKQIDPSITNIFISERDIQ
jgi:hypothetical protein